MRRTNISCIMDAMQFEEVFSQPDPKEDLCKLIDPRLGDDYPLDSVCKVTKLFRK